MDVGHTKSANKYAAYIPMSDDSMINFVWEYWILISEKYYACSDFLNAKMFLISEYIRDITIQRSKDESTVATY